MAHATFKQLTTQQRQIIRDICKQNLSSLRRLYNNNTEVDIQLILAEAGVEKDVWEETLEESLDKFKTVLDKPHEMHKLDKFDLSIFRHILTNIEDNYKANSPEDIRDLWERLFTIEKFFDQPKDSYLNN